MGLAVQLFIADVIGVGIRRAAAIAVDDLPIFAGGAAIFAAGLGCFVACA